MPIYEYECIRCEKIHEVSQKLSDEPLKECPDCGQQVQKLISLSAFALKGAGFYTNDYKRAGTTKKTDCSNATNEKSGCGSGACQT